MTEQEQKLLSQIRELEKQNNYLHAQIKNQRYGLTWIDVPEAFDAESKNKIPILEEVPDKSFTDNSEKPTHILIEGDNYHALQCLSYTHKGKVDVIYIDPPYNTGSDGFTYKDKRILTEFPDGTPVPKDHPLRHSYWLSFMHKRLELAKNLLSEDGVIFISIDDNEQANLKLLCDEVFGGDNFIGLYLKQSKIGGGGDSKFIVKEHEYCLVYAKNINETFEMFIEHDKDYLKRYKEKDENGCFFWDTFARPGLKNPIHYDIVAPDGTVMNYGWIHGEERFQEELKNGIVRIIPKKGGGWSVQFKQYLNQGGKKPRSMTMDFGGSIDGKKDLVDIFNNDRVFRYPKSCKFIATLLKTVNMKSTTILDFFAGSGTTMHAVSKLNDLDNGTRQCILVQQNEDENKICEEVTYERNRRVMQGYTNASGEQVAGLGGSLKYYKTAFVNGGKNDHNPIKRPLDSDKVALAKHAGTLISLAENTLYRQEEPNEYYEIFTDKQGKFAAVYKQEDYARFDEFENKVKSLQGNVVIYTFSWSNTPDAATNFLGFPNVEVKAFPNAIIDSYNKAIKQIENNK